MSWVTEQFAVEDRVQSLTGYVNAATAAMVAELAPLLASGAWAGDGIRSKEHYVAWQTGSSPARAQRLVAIAERLGELPRCEALFAAGRIGEDAMALLARHARPERDEELAELAPLMTYTQLAKAVRALPKDPAPEPRREPATRFWDDDERFHLRVDADQDEGALFKRALEAARDDLFRQRFPDADEDRLAVAGVTWHDAMLWMAELTLNASDPEVRRGGRPSDRYQVHVHLDRRQLADPTATLHLGPVIRDSIARYLSCDATVSTVIWDGDRLVGINPRERTVNDRLRRQIEQRDRGCRVPGCTQTRWLHAHHITHAEDGGATVPCNLCCLCPFHHRLHHAGLLRIEGSPETPDGLRFFDAHGHELKPPELHAHHGPPDEPPAHLVTANPEFARPLGERMDWRYWSWLTIAGCPN